MLIMQNRDFRRFYCSNRPFIINIRILTKQRGTAKFKGNGLEKKEHLFIKKN